MNRMTSNILTSCDSNSSYTLITSNDKFCNWFYDEKTCWPIAKANTNVSQPCPKVQGFDKMKMAYKYCTENGSWENVTNFFGPTDYSSCYTPELTEMLEKLGSDYDTKRKLDIALNTGVIEVVGCLVSIISLIISLCIFIRHKGILEQRFKIHMNLFVALSLQMFIKLILNIDKLDLFKTKKDLSNVTCLVDCNNQIRLVKDDDNNWFFGIMYTPIICEGSQVILEWSKTASFMWMYNEGVYLYRIIKSRVLRINSINFRMYLFGWGLPALMTSVWLLVTMVYYKKSSSVCWWGYSLLPFFWILEGPRMIILVVNLIILIIVLRELLKKIKSKLSPSNELDIIRKVSKAAIALVPLLGITNFILVIIPEPHSKSPELFAYWSYSAHILHSFQGLMVSILYCFMNKEIKKSFDKRMMLQKSRRDFEMEMTYNLFKT
ncbi:PDF receptor [Metopolophium dirhodum]|uniref:PDF receptor n=1 Tax=Metopolophium dirhodum TaxID=44670 RepID=UPI00299039D1|nr:PDF receptor [Metopolophium dirhodum]XP_060880460.1 PDF receptor [Metopolophium dirhodum]